MKLFIANSWIDDRPVLSNERIEAGTLYTAAIHAARRTRSKNFFSGKRKSKLTVRVEFVSVVNKI